MGCDIHPVLERRWKNPKTGETKWIGMHAYPYVTVPEVWSEGKVVAKNVWHSPRPQERNYRLFAALAGVRGDGPEPRGLPEDASDLAMMAIGEDNVDLHSHSWATAREYVEACLAVDASDDEALRAAMLLQSTEEPRIKNPFEYYMELDEFYDEPGYPTADDYRIVFAFDN